MLGREAEGFVLARCCRRWAERHGTAAQLTAARERLWDALRRMEDALAVEQAGAFAVVVECVPAAVARKITAALRVPTIGIGAGPDCDGQVLVTPDLLGMFDELRPRFVKRYAELGEAIRRAAADYCREVREGEFPAAEHAFR